MSELYQISSDGLSLAVECAGRGRPLVFSHGLTNNRQQGFRLLGPLVGDHRFVTFDQRGHATSSPVTDPELYHPERMVGDIAAVMDGLDIQRALLAGESMGAATALLFALHWPERVDRLLLVAPAFGDVPNPNRDWMKELGIILSSRQGVEEYIAAASVSEWPEQGFSPATISCLSGYLRSHDPASMGGACQAVADWVILSNLSELVNLSLPVYIIAWDKDPTHPVELASRMAASLPAAHLTTVPSMATIFNDMESVGHMFAQYLAQVDGG